MLLQSYKKLGFFGKVVIPILIVLPVSTGINIFYLNKAAEKTVVDSSVEFATGTIEQFKMLRAYYTENVVKKIKEQTTLQVGVQHKDDPNTVPLPATMIHDLSQKFADAKSGMKLKLYSDFPFPNRKDRVLDQFSKDALEYFKKNPDKVFSRVDLKSEAEIVRVAVADKMVAQSCVQCHNSHPQSPFKDWKIGDVRGVLEVEVPIKKQMAANAAMVGSSGGLSFGMTVLLLVVIGLILFYYIAKPIENIINKLNSSVDDAATQSSTLAASSTEVSSACSEQASAIQETMATLDEIRAMTAKGTDGARNSMGVSKSSHSIALEGKRSVEQMIGAIKDIDESNRMLMAQVDESNKQIAEIVEVIAQIQTKTKVIFDIVFQTKLLSFNASVEAARAGENGKGFAVVAEEVGSLANVSGNAAKEITDMLEKSVQRVQNIVDLTKSRVESSVRNGTEKVEAGSEIAKRCGEILDQVVHNVNEVDRLMADICLAAEEQEKGVEGITIAMSQLDKATNLNAASAEKTSDVSNELMTQADSLRELVKQFEVEALGKNNNKSL
ncbi:methyl-accepting chemotaxis protein [Pseudobdellovibrio sp. HCB154]|uniref:methyl-accepting chemotaxis protein n=1 Tax=Pseudobdellovibrio sp. HCB154 TaxID=3386277 RepID=UPI0039171E8C